MWCLFTKNLRVFVFTLLVTCLLGVALWQLKSAPSYFFPCDGSVACFWTLRGESDGIRAATRVGITIDHLRLSQLVKAIDTLHGALLQQEENDEEFFSEDPEQFEDPEGISAEYQSLIQNVVDKVWNDAAFRVTGSQRVLGGGIAALGISIAKFALTDEDYLHAFLESHFPALSGFLTEMPSAELSYRENLPRGVHHTIVQITVEDLYDIYFQICSGDPAAAVCAWMEENQYSPLGVIEAVEALAGSDAAVDVGFYWTVRDSQVLWSNSRQMVEDTAVWAPSRTLEALESASAVAQSTISQGVWVDVALEKAIWNSVRNEVENQVQDGNNAQGFLLFPDVLERLERLTQSFSAPVLFSHFALSAAFSERTVSSKVFVLKSDAQPGRLDGTVSINALLRDWTGVLLPEVSPPVVSQFANTVLSVRPGEWAESAFEMPSTGISAPLMRRLGAVNSDTLLAFD